jgi:hypothetical protein
MDVKSLVEYIDYEILRSNNQKKQYGWNVWGLTLCMATLMWLFFDYVESRELGIFGIARAFLLMYEIFVFITLLYKSIEVLLVGFEQERPFHFITSNASVSALILSLFENAAILLVVSWLGFVITKWLFWMLLFQTLFVLVVLGFYFWLYYSDLPVFASPIKGNNRLIYSAFFLVPAVLILIVVVAAFGELMPLLTIQYFRAAILLMAVYVLFKILTTVLKTDSLSATLYRIRSELSLGKIKVEDAANKTDIILNGMRASDVFQKEISAFMKQSFEVSELMSVIDAEWEKTSADDMDEDVARMFLEKYAKQQADLTARKKVLNDQFCVYHQKVSKLLKVFPACFRDVEEIMGLMSAEMGMYLRRSEKQDGVRDRRIEEIRGKLGVVKQ